MPRFRFPIALLFVVLAGCGPAQAPFTRAQRDTAESEVREAVEQLTAAMGSRDSEQVLAFYRESREFVFLGCTDLMFGSEVFSRVLGPYWDSRPGPAVEREILRVQVLNPGTAVVTLRGGSQDASALFWTQVLVREADGRWLIAHEHQSWPGCAEPPRLHDMGDPGNPGEAGVSP
jgi:uncharacterized protein (TIGR02246 family)